MSRTKQRRQRILDLIGSGDINVDALAERLEVSPSTIRRDLADLSRGGSVTRTYGGAVLARPQGEQTLTDRERINRSAKEAIGQAAAALIDDGDCLLLDAGSTVAALGRQLGGRQVRIVTGNLPLVPQLIEWGIDVTVLGGSVRPLSMGVMGPLAEMALTRLTADKAFLSADGVVAGRGLCEAHADQCSLKELMMAQAGEVFVLADASKLGRASQQHWAPICRPWTLITDADAMEDQLEPFERLGCVRVIRA